MKKPLGIYIHVPFCLRKCNYCDFCSFAGKADTLGKAYTDELARRVLIAADSARAYEVDTVYFGGGTPSLLPPRLLGHVLDTVRKGFSVTDTAEITLECNPATVELAALRELRTLGFNRLSVGLQSTVDSELSLLGRAHTYADFVSCFGDARRAGFENISVDLMYGIPEQTEETLIRSVDLLTSHSPEHISAYGLMIEEGTDFYRRRNSLNVADDDMQAAMYSIVGERLERAGYKKYEISNFAREGFESRHNLRYWRGLEYLGFGVAAHSYFDNQRFGNSPDVDAFVRGEDIIEEREVITPDERRREFVMLGLRLTEGISLAEYGSRFGKSFDADFFTEKFVSEGFMAKKDDRIALTEKGLLVSNSILSALLYGD